MVGKLDRLMGVLLYVSKNHFFFAKIRSTPPPPAPTHSALAVLCFFLFSLLPNQPIISGNTADESVWVKRQRMLRNRNRLPRGPFSSFRFQTVKHRKTNPRGYKNGNSKYFRCQPLAASWSGATRPISLDKL